MAPEKGSRNVRMLKRHNNFSFKLIQQEFSRTKNTTVVTSRSLFKKKQTNKHKLNVFNIGPVFIAHYP